MKILVIGDFASPIHEEAFCVEFISQGHEVIRFKISSYFYRQKDISETYAKSHKSIFHRAELRLGYGPVLWRMNRELANLIVGTHFDIIFVYRGKYLNSKALRAISASSAVACIYNNDNPFSDLYSENYWDSYLASLPHFDWIFAYRESNLADYARLGYHNVSLLRSYFREAANYPDERASRSKYSCDVVFVGHFENDGRDELFKKVLEAGFDLKIFGPEWGRSKYHEFFRERMGEIYPLGADYNVAINSAKIALVVFSRLNKDQYTRRCFEITATGTLMLCQRADEVRALFEEDKEAAYFSTAEELVAKLQQLLDNPSQREKIAEAGRLKLLKSGHSITNRAGEILRVHREITLKPADRRYETRLLDNTP